jgi:hypothetical protein
MARGPVLATSVEANIKAGLPVHITLGSVLAA